MVKLIEEIPSLETPTIPTKLWLKDNEITAHLYFYEEDGDVTPTKKVKRAFLEKRYADVIDGLYTA